MNELFTKDEALKNIYKYFDSLKELVKSVSYPIENEFDLNEVLYYLKFRKDDYININSIDVFKNLDLLKHYNSIDSLDIFKDEFNSINTIYNYYHNLQNPLVKVDNKELKKLIFEISIKLKGLDNYYSDSINNDSNYSHNVFVNLKAEKLFLEYINKYIIDPYIDYSFIFQQMKHDKLLRSIKHLEFAKWLKDNNLINEKNYLKISDANGFRALDKCYNANRFNNYLLLKESV